MTGNLNCPLPDLATSIERSEFSVSCTGGKLYF